MASGSPPPSPTRAAAPAAEATTGDDARQAARSRTAQAGRRRARSRSCRGTGSGWPARWAGPRLRPGSWSRKRRAASGKDAIRKAHERAYHFMSAIAGDLAGFEEATRALFANESRPVSRRSSRPGLATFAGTQSGWRSATPESRSASPPATHMKMPGTVRRPAYHSPAVAGVDPAALSRPTWTSQADHGQTETHLISTFSGGRAEPARLALASAVSPSRG